MTRTRPAAALLAFALAVAATPTLAQSVSFGSPLVEGNGDPRQSNNVTCYFSNAGKRAIALQNVTMSGLRGETFTPGSNTCGALTGFDLSPGETCFIGASVRLRPNGVACRSRAVGDAAYLRGSIEVRTQGHIVLESASLSIGRGQNSPEAFRDVSSPPLFGSPQQTDARCSFTNVGEADARLKDFRFVRSDGSVAPMAYNGCAATGEYVLAPGRTCEIGMSFAAGSATDIQCRAQTTRKADIRGILRVIEAGEVRNSRPLE